MRNVSPSFDIESSYWSRGYQYVCGIDEVGRGCFAGPVVAGAVIFPPQGKFPEGLKDSKLLTSKQRKKLEKEIKQTALGWYISEVSVDYINKIGIGKATQMAFRQAVRKILPLPDYILIDAFYIRNLNKTIQSPVKDGDTLCASIAAGSVIAKVYRDELMEQLDQDYPDYGFIENKGYGTLKHQQAIKQYGLCPLHRKSFNLAKFL